MFESKDKRYDEFGQKIPVIISCYHPGYKGEGGVINQVKDIYFKL